MIQVKTKIRMLLQALSGTTYDTVEYKQLMNKLLSEFNNQVSSFIRYLEREYQNKRTLTYEELIALYAAHGEDFDTIPTLNQCGEEAIGVARELELENDARIPLYRVWYGTNRQPVNMSGQKCSYSGVRSVAMSTSSFGQCEVYVPRSHRFGSVGSSWYKRWLTGMDDRLKLHRITQMSGHSFWTNLTKELSMLSSDDHQAVVYIHGYNVSFEEAAIRAAQIGFDLKVRGVMAFYSWCSAGTTASYSVDEASIEVSEGAITEFLCEFVEKVGAGKVHVIAHSMGNRGLLRSLKGIMENAERRAVIKFGQIILAAPDLDAELFRQAASAYHHLSTRTTLYASPKDRAVGLSRWLHGAPRAGFTPPVTVATGVDTVLIPGFDIDLLGHSYYAEAEGVLHDIYDTLHSNDSPSKRPRLMQTITSNGDVHWVMN